VNYTVIWLPDAEQELAAIWLAALDRQVVTRTAHAIDSLLRHDPATQGESREGDRRILIALPLCVVFRVVEEARRVEVIHVWTC
jgi:plasmid stabilization system protein ParE